MQSRTGGMLYYFTLAMTAIYAVLGIYIMVSDSLEGFLPGKKKYLLGVTLIVYSAYRAFRIVKLNKQIHNQG